MTNNRISILCCGMRAMRLRAILLLGMTLLSANAIAAPTVSISANPISVVSGSTTTLTWSSTGATTCAARGDWSGIKAISGSQVIRPSKALNSYTLSCSGPTGSASNADSVGSGNPAPPTYTLTASVTGQGSIASAPSGIACPGDCTQSYLGATAVTLNATPAAGQQFSAWGGACSGSGACALTMNSNQTVSATFTAIAQGTTYYVSPSGNDSSNGLSLATPFRTISHAVDVVNPGAVIEIRAGTYSESILITRPGASGNGIVMRAYNNEPVLIKSSGAGPTIYFYHNNCDETVIGNGSGNTDCQPFYWTIQGLSVQGSPNGGGDGNAIKIDTPRVTLSGNKLCCAKADVVKLVRTSNGVAVLNNEIWQDPAIVIPDANAQGVDIVGADDVRVANNYLHDIDDIGIYAKGNSRRAVFESNRLERIGLTSGANALMLGQSTDAFRVVDGNYETYDGVMRNNIVSNSGGPCLATASSFNVRIYNNSCYNTGQVLHGSILISNESELAQPGTNIDIKNNIIYGSSNNPIIKISNFMGPALTDNTTLNIDKNLYYWIGGATPTFSWDGNFTGISFSQWQTNYTSLTGHADTSRVLNPLYADLALLTLQPASAAINGGVNTPYVTSDYLGVARPQGGTTDIGAYEFVSTPVAAEIPTAAGASQLFRYPYLQTDSARTMKILWATAASGACVVQYKLSTASAWTTQSACSGVEFTSAATGLAASYFQHEVVLNNLQPNTAYLYNVLHDGVVLASNVGFVTLKEDVSATTQFIVFGDSGTQYSTPRNVRDAIASKDTNGNYIYPHDFIVGVGDIAYTNGTYAEFDSNFFNQLSGKNDPSGGVPSDGLNGILATRPFFPVLGNHEYAQSPTNVPSAYLDSFSPPLSGVATADAERYYSFDSGNAHFVVIDSENFENGAPADRLARMMAWLDADLAATTKTWRIAFLHRTIFSNGSHGTWGDTAPNNRMRSQLAPLLQNRGVQLVMFGHDHAYQRSKRLRVDSGGKIMRDATHNVVDSSAGIIYVMSGMGGADLYNCEADPNAQYGSAKYNNYVSQYGDGYDFVATRNGAVVLFSAGGAECTGLPTAPVVDERYGFVQVNINGATLSATTYNYNGVVLDQFSMAAN